MYNYTPSESRLRELVKKAIIDNPNLQKIQLGEDQHLLESFLDYQLGTCLLYILLSIVVSIVISSVFFNASLLFPNAKAINTAKASCGISYILVIFPMLYYLIQAFNIYFDPLQYTLKYLNIYGAIFKF